MPVITGHKLKEEFIKMKLLKRLLREEEGATMVEYGLMVALIAVVVMAVVVLLGAEIADMFQRVLDQLALI